MSEFRSLLDREAGRAVFGDDAFERTIRRSARRQRRRGLIMGAVAVGAVAAILVPLWIGLTRTRPVSPASPQPSKTSVDLRHMQRELPPLVALQRELQHASRSIAARRATLQPCGGCERAKHLSAMNTKYRFQLVFVGQRIFELRTEIASALLGGPDGDGRLASPIVLPGTDESFDPPPAGVRPALNASEALAEYAERNTGFVLRPGLRAHLGLYTGAGGTRLAWGYSSNGCPSRFPTTTPPLASRCTSWLFIDAQAGRMIVAILQGPRFQLRQVRP